MMQLQAMRQWLRQLLSSAGGVLLFLVICGGLSQAQAQGACALPGGNPGCQSDSASLPGVNGSTGAGNPIDLTTGNKYQQEVDVELPGALPLALRRHYNSQSGISRDLGPGWTHTYETRLTRTQRKQANVPDAIAISIIQGDGRTLSFVPTDAIAANPAVRYFISRPTGYGVLEERIAALEQLRAQRQGARDTQAAASTAVWIWRWPNGRQLKFDGRGLLSEIEDGPDKLTLHFDGQRRLQRIADNHGREVQAQYWDDPLERLEVYGAKPTAAHGYRARLKRLKLPDGGEVRYGYDAAGYLTEVRYADGRSKRYGYQRVAGAAYLSQITERDGQLAARFAYDAAGNAIHSAHPGGVDAVTLAYQWPKQPGEIGITGVTNAQGQRTEYRWRMDPVTGAAQILEAHGPGCATCAPSNVRHSYDRTGRHDSTTTLDDQGQPVEQERMSYDSLGREIRTERAQFVKDQLQMPYWQQHRDYTGAQFLPTRIVTPSVVSGRVHELRISYNERGQPTQIMERGWDPAGSIVLQPWRHTPSEIERSVQLRYDAHGRVTHIDGPRRAVDDGVSLTYDNQGRLATLTRPGGSRQAVLAYDLAGRPTRLARSDAPEVALSYDAMGRLIKVTEVNVDTPHTVSYAYDARGRLISLTAPDGQRVKLGYDAANRPTRYVDERSGHAAEIRYGLDQQINASLLRDRSGQVLHTLAYSYDAQQRLAAIHDGAGRTLRQYGYDDADQRPDRLIDPLGMQTLLSYDRFGRVTQQQAADGGVTEITYQDSDGVQRITAANGAATRYTYDDFGQRVREDSADRGSTRYFHDASGNLIAQVDARGKIQRYRYDAANRLIHITRRDGATTLAYQAGRLTRIAGAWGEERFTYDARGRLTAHTRILDGREFTTGYQYDADGKLTGKRLPDGQRLKYHYSEDGPTRGKLRAITQEKLFTQQVLIGELEEASSISTTDISFHSRLVYGNGLSTDTTIDPSTDRIERRTTPGVHDFNYHYDAAGRLTGIDFNKTKARYDYDAVGRLTNARTPLGEFNYRYDPNGNRLSATQPAASAARYTYAAASNRLTRIEADTDADTPYQYDAAGHPTHIGAKRYEYDSIGRPIQFYIDDQLKTSYAYNAFGQRIKKVVYSGQQPTVTYFLYDHQQLSAEANGNGEITQQYLYQDHAPVVTLIGTDPYFIHSDHLGTPRAVTDEDQRVVWSADYAPFGAAQTNEDPDQDGKRLTLNLRFPGQYADQESGTYYNYFRDYDPQTGRYRTSDPIGLGGGINTFTYAAGSPIDGFDPLGLAVYLTSHQIEPTDSWHTALMLVPDDQAAFASQNRFLTGSPDDGEHASFRLFTIISAGPANSINPFRPGNLVGRENRETDFPAENVVNRQIIVSSPLSYSNACATNPPSDTELINYLIRLTASYQNNARYGYPRRFSSTGELPEGTFNSNSYISGILNMIGASTAAPSANDYPGFDRPLPRDFFTVPTYTSDN